MDGPKYVRLRASIVEDGGDPMHEAAVLEECEDIVRTAVRNSRFPPHYSPTGSWDEEAIQEVLANWLCYRAVERGQVKAMMVTSPTLQIFRGQVKTSVRQSIFDQLRRSQARNLFPRILEILETSTTCRSRGTGNNAFWYLDGATTEMFEGEDRALLNVAYGVGDFEEIRYSADAKKLSPLLERDDLERLVLGLLAAGAMTTGTLNRAVCLRFGVSLGETHVELHDYEVRERIADPEEEVLLDTLATAAADELSERQMAILQLRAGEKTGTQIAAELGCSEATISMENSKIRAILARTGADDSKVLKKLLEGRFR